MSTTQSALPRYYSPATGGFYLEGIHDIPGDAVEVTEDLFDALMDAQAEGQEIVAGDDGAPLAQDRTQTTDDLLAALRARRDKLLAASDFTQLPDCPLADDQKAEWQSYRTALRNLPETCADNPADAIWPDQPETASA